MKPLIKKLFFITFFFYLPFQSMAWGMLGHRIVGQIAESYLNKKAKLAVTQILGDESLAMSANWADYIKSEPSFNYLSAWHYIDFDKPYTYVEMQAFLKQDTATDAYTKINFLVAQLKNKNLDLVKQRMYLRLLVHLVGDIHQPMHTAHTSDKGGNDVKVLWFNQPSNLHSIWDSGLIENQQLSYTEYANAINHTKIDQRLALQKEDISKWIFDSSQIAEKIYAYGKPGDKLGYRYNYDFLDTVNQQLLKGGVHLAGLLNQIFGS